VTARELIGPLAFGVFVAITTIQCRYHGTAQMILAIISGMALALWAYLFSRSMRERQDK
jgi:hypothetical protein